jgi:hypothetical protein
VIPLEMVEAWVLFERFWPWKSASALRPPPCAGGSPPVGDERLFQKPARAFGRLAC